MFPLIGYSEQREGLKINPKGGDYISTIKRIVGRIGAIGFSILIVYVFAYHSGEIATFLQKVLF